MRNKYPLQEHRCPRLSACCVRPTRAGCVEQPRGGRHGGARVPPVSPACIRDEGGICDPSDQSERSQSGMTSGAGRSTRRAHSGLGRKNQLVGSVRVQKRHYSDARNSGRGWRTERCRRPRRSCSRLSAGGRCVMRGCGGYHPCGGYPGGGVQSGMVDEGWEDGGRTWRGNERKEGEMKRYVYG